MNILHYVILVFISIHSSLALSSQFSPSNFLSLWHSKHLYKFGDDIDLLVNTVSSSQSNIPYAYYKVPFVCPPSSSVKPVHLSLAEILNGDNLMQSDYQLVFGNDSPCLRLCDRIMAKRNIIKSIDLIKQNYIVDWVIDGLPASTTFISDNLTERKKYYVPGFPMGFVKGDDAYVNNHVLMVIRYHKEKDNQYSIVGFEVYPKSVDDFTCPGASKNFEHTKLDASNDFQLIHFTYSVYWKEEPEIDYNNRMKLFIDPSLIDSNGKLLSKPSNNNKAIHWVSLINSLVLATFVSLVAAFIILINFRSSIQSASQSSFAQISQNSFTKPRFLPLLSLLTGSGVQLVFTLLASGILSSLFLRKSFANDSKILALTIFILIIGGFFAGFSSIQLLKLFSTRGEQLSIWKTSLISSLSGSMLISLGLAIVVVVNTLIFSKDSPRSMKFSNFLQLFILYIFFQLPISLIGGLISRKFNLFTNLLSSSLDSAPYTSASNKVSVAKTPLYLRFPFSMLIIGLFPCGIVFIESRFVYMTLLSERATTYLLGFLVLSAILLSIVMIEIGIISTYIRLLKNTSQYNWQWWTFLNCSISIWLYLESTSLYQLLKKLKTEGSTSPFLFIAYSSILNTIVALTCGTLALWSATIFIYSIVLISTKKKD